MTAICAQKRTIAVSGTHGKTTTSAMLSVILTEAGSHPSMIVGGDITGFGSGAVWDPVGEWLVVEADESDGTFNQLGAEIVVVTSVEADHLDFYGDEATMRAAFERFVSEAPGSAILCADDPGSSALCAVAAGRGVRVETYGMVDGATVVIGQVELGRSAATFEVSRSGRPTVPVSLSVPGVHNVRNATAAMTAAHAAGIGWSEGASAVAGFRGVGRRFERRGERRGVTFVDDYGHLPTEIRATIAAAQAGRWDRLVVVFQPHRYSRTEALWPEFADAFGGADILVVTDVYPAGEPPRPGVTGRLIFDAVVHRHPDTDVRYCPTLDDAARELTEILRAGDLCLTLGAGDLTALPTRMLTGGGI